MVEGTRVAALAVGEERRLVHEVLDVADPDPHRVVPAGVAQVVGQLRAAVERRDHVGGGEGLRLGVEPLDPVLGRHQRRRAVHVDVGVGRIVQLLAHEDEVAAPLFRQAALEGDHLVDPAVRLVERVDRRPADVDLGEVVDLFPLAEGAVAVGVEVAVQRAVVPVRGHVVVGGAVPRRDDRGAVVGRVVAAQQHEGRAVVAVGAGDRVAELLRVVAPRLLGQDRADGAELAGDPLRGPQREQPLEGRAQILRRDDQVRDVSVAAGVGRAGQVGRLGVRGEARQRGHVARQAARQAARCGWGRRARRGHGPQRQPQLQLGPEPRAPARRADLERGHRDRRDAVAAEQADADQPRRHRGVGLVAAVHLGARLGAPPLGPRQALGRLAPREGVRSGQLAREPQRARRTRLHPGRQHDLQVGDRQARQAGRVGERGPGPDHRHDAALDRHELRSVEVRANDQLVGRDRDAGRLAGRGGAECREQQDEAGEQRRGAAERHAHTSARRVRRNAPMNCVTVPDKAPGGPWPSLPRR